MNKINRSTATKLLEMMNGERLPASKLKSSVIYEMVGENIIVRRVFGRTKVLLHIPDPEAFKRQLQNKYGIPDLSAYIAALENEDLTRSDAVKAASDSKIKQIRTFKGFPVNCLEPVMCELNEKIISINPQPGAFTFIYDYETFIPDKHCTIVGIENPENFRHIEKQKHLFNKRKYLFVSRYPQSKDLIKWLLRIPNTYLHFGDFDLAGINIYFTEFKKHLGNQATFFVPDNIEQLFQNYGNRELYDKQLHLTIDRNAIDESGVNELLDLIHRFKMGVEQEGVIV